MDDPAQYERNTGGCLPSGAKLPFVGLCMNASKAETRLDIHTTPNHPPFLKECSPKTFLNFILVCK